MLNSAYSLPKINTMIKIHNELPRMHWNSKTLWHLVDVIPVCLTCQVALSGFPHTTSVRIPTVLHPILPYRLITLTVKSHGPTAQSLLNQGCIPLRDSKIKLSVNNGLYLGASTSFNINHKNNILQYGVNNSSVVFR